jgi:uncharacterized alkaline shock family protein YloU
MKTIHTDFGEINITKKTIESIVSLNLADIKGVVGSKKTIMKEIANMLTESTNDIDTTNKSIKVEINNNKIIINLFIIIKYGVRIPDIAWDIQNRIKKEIIKKLGTDVQEINIRVQGIQFPQKTKSKKDLVTSFGSFVKVF